MHLLIDISAHGLGHLAQIAPVVTALQQAVPTLRLTVRSALPHSRLTRRIAADFAHVAHASDFGFAMHNAIDIDRDASRRRYQDFHADWTRRVADEAAWLRAQRIDALLSNVAYLPLAGAAAAGLPAAALCSLNWADLFADVFGGEDWAPPIHGQMLAAYTTARGFLRVSPGLPMPDMVKRIDIDPIARLGRRDRAAIARLTGADPQQRWVLVAMGGMEFRLPVEDWPRTAGLTWLVPQEWQARREDVCSVDFDGLDFTDLLASADAVITKPGYGIFAEAACNGTPALYVRREQWLEEPYLAAWLCRHNRAGALTREQLERGDFLADLDALWRAPAPPRPTADGVRQAVLWLLENLGLGA